MPKRYFNCPHCFRKIRTVDVHYACDCGFCFKPAHSLAVRLGLASLPTMLEPSPEQVQRESSSRQRCKIFPTGHRCSSKRCPYKDCASHLPTDITQLSDFSIAIIGAKGTGKSHYVACLIERLSELSIYNKWHLQAATEESTRLYTENYRKPLYQDLKTLEQTNRGVPRPLVFQLRIGGKTIMLTFLDAAGEHFDSVEDMSNYTRYLWQASGIICLVDPLQFPAVRIAKEEYASHAKIPLHLPTVASSPAEILTRLETMLMRSSSMKKSGKISIPLAVAFSKSDAMQAQRVEDIGYLFDPHHEMASPSPHMGKYSKRESLAINDYLQDWLCEVDVDESALIGPLRSFSKTRFFSMSSLGSAFQSQGTLFYPPRPLRVEDPILWILNHYGFISCQK